MRKFTALIFALLSCISGIVFRTGGTPYLREETDLIKRLTGQVKKMNATK
ncbi:MAG TPA: hypothetical protein VK400_15305 [Pyrinomonadaceae bacterium]|nr:hypothetical protein [Pyrinomonadaceae bacterium]